MADQIRRPRPRSERGMVTSEYAVATIGTCGLACVLIALSPGFEPFLRELLELAISPVRRGLLW